MLTLVVPPHPSLRPSARVLRSTTSLSPLPRPSTASLLVMLVTRVVLLLTFKPQRRLLTSSPRPLSRLVTPARSRSPSTLLPASSTRPTRRSTTLTSRTLSPTRASGSLMSSSPTSTRLLLPSTPLSASRIPSPRTTGRPGATSSRPLTSRLLGMCFFLFSC